jgi:integrase
MRPMGRAKGQGTITPISDSPGGQKRWRVAVTMADGRRVWRTAHSPREAERVRAKLVEARELDLDPTRQTLAAWLRSWIAAERGAKVSRIRPTTLDTYGTIIEKHIIPALGAYKLSAVTPARVQAWIDADASAPRTIHHHHAVLRRALNVAVRRRLLPWNAAASVELPAVKSDRSDALTLEEARTLIATSAGVDEDGRPVDRLAPLWRLALVTGMRQGELLGLAWDDVKPDAIEVRAQLTRRIADAERELATAEGRKPRGSWTTTPTKAARKVQRIALDPDTIAVLDAHRKRMAAERTPEWRWYGHVFVTPQGRPYHGAEVLDAFHAACRRAGIRERRFHDLRHSSAHLLADAGVTEDVRMGRLGHSTTTMSRHYAGASEARDRDAAERMGKAISG